LLWLAVVLPAPAQTTLEWKFEDGKKFFVEAVTTTKQKITIGDKTTESESTFTTVSSFVIKKAEGGYSVDQTIEGVKVKTNKDNDPTVALVSRFANQLKGTQFHFTMSPSGKITSPKLEGYNDLIKKLSGGNDAAEQVNKAKFPEEMFREELNLIFGFLPDKPVSPGATWVGKKQVVPLPLGTLTGESTYTYVGKKPEGEEISVSQKWSYELPKETVGGLKVTKGSLNVDAASGKIIADPAAGKLIRHDESRHVSGKLTLTDMNMKDTVYDVDQTTTRTIRRVEENPLK
jgi:hypothetical protein